MQCGVKEVELSRSKRSRGSDNEEVDLCGGKQNCAQGGGNIAANRCKTIYRIFQVRKMDNSALQCATASRSMIYRGTAKKQAPIGPLSI